MASVFQSTFAVEVWVAAACATPPPSNWCKVFKVNDLAVYFVVKVFNLKGLAVKSSIR